MKYEIEITYYIEVEAEDSENAKKLALEELQNRNRHHVPSIGIQAIEDDSEEQDTTEDNEEEEGQY